MSEDDREAKILQSLLEHETRIRNGPVPNSPPGSIQRNETSKAESIEAEPSEVGSIEAEPSEVELREVELGKRALNELSLAIQHKKSSMPSWVPCNIGRFEIRAVLGAGGFAVVYLAFDPTLERCVALKIPRPHVLTDLSHQRRFVYEAQTSAKLDHSNIVPIYEAGQDGDLPYIACAWCDGPTLAEWHGKSPVDPQLAASIIRQLAAAVQYSHEHGILHSDIKPGNVLLFPDQSPSGSQFPYTPKLADFGLAKSLESELDTVTSNLIGTPQYMAPEIIAYGTSAASVGSDVYSLGAVLYCLLVGHPPFETASTMQALRLIVEQDPASPYSLRKEVGRDLSLICMKCLQKSPALRYASARELKADLRRYQEGRPILARQTPWLVRLQKWCAQRPLVSALLALAGCLVIALVWLAWDYTASLQSLNGRLTSSSHELEVRAKELASAVENAERNKSEADIGRRLADELTFAADLNLADALRRSGDIRGSQRVLNRYDRNSSDKNPTIDGNDSFAWRFLRDSVSIREQVLESIGQAVWDMKISPDGQRIAMCGSAGKVRICKASNGSPTEKEKQVVDCELNGISWSNHAPFLAVSGDDGIVRVCDAESLEVIQQLSAFPGKQVYGVGFIPGTNQILVTGQTADIQLWDSLTGEFLSNIASPHAGTIECLEVSPDGKLFATGGDDGQVCLWRTSDFSVVWKSDNEGRSKSEPIGQVKFASDSSFLVTTEMKEWICLYDSLTGQKLNQWIGLDKITALAVGKEAIVCGDQAGLLSEFSPSKDRSNWKPRRQWLGHEGNLSAMTVISDNSNRPKIVSADRNGKISDWSNSQSSQIQNLPPKKPDALYSNRFIDWMDRFRLACCGGRLIQAFDRDDSVPCKVYTSDRVITCVTWAPAASALIGATDQGDLVLLTSELEKICEFSVLDNQPITDISVDESARIAVVRGPQSDISVVDIAQHKSVMRLSNENNAQVSPDGKWLVVSRKETDTYHVFDLATLERKHELQSFDATHSQATFSADSKFFAAAGDDRTIAVWETRGWTETLRIPRMARTIGTIALHPDRRTLACTDDENRVSLLDIRSGRELATIWTGSMPVRTLTFSEDGESLGVCHGNLETTILNAPKRTTVSPTD